MSEILNARRSTVTWVLFGSCPVVPATAILACSGGTTSSSIESQAAAIMTDASVEDGSTTNQCPYSTPGANPVLCQYWGPASNTKKLGVTGECIGKNTSDGGA